MTCITDFPHSGADISAALIPAARAAAAGDRILFFPPGEYHIYPSGCTTRYCYFSNNDHGLKTIALRLEDLEDFTVRGPGALLIFHGRISPLFAFNCRNLTVEGLKVDFEDSFVSDADLVKRENGVAWFRFPGKHRVEAGRIIFTDDPYDNLSGKLPFISYDPATGEIPYDSKTITVPNRAILCRDGLVGVEDRFAEAKTTAFMVKHEERFCPGMVFDGCRDLNLKDVTIHHCCGIGIMIQNTENCRLHGVVVEPRGRRASSSVDSVHIADCRGKIRVEECRLSGTLDDSLNVHGMFRKLKSRIPGGKFYYLEQGHRQQEGVFNVRAGDTMRLYDRRSGRPYAEIKLTDVKAGTSAFVAVKFDESELPAEFVQGDPALIVETLAELEVVNTECRPLHGRGILASGLKKVHISGCRLHSSFSGVFISGDWSYWYESGPVEEAVIENNVFDNCDYNLYGPTQEALAVFPELAELTEGYFYHGAIRILNNTFRAPVRPLISVMSAAEAEVTGNRLESNDRYPFVPRSVPGWYFTNADSPAISFLHCGKIIERDNAGFDPTTGKAEK